MFAEFGCSMWCECHLALILRWTDFFFCFVSCCCLVKNTEKNECLQLYGKCFNLMKRGKKRINQCQFTLDMLLLFLYSNLDSVRSCAFFNLFFSVVRIVSAMVHDVCARIHNRNWIKNLWMSNIVFGIEKFKFECFE